MRSEAFRILDIQLYERGVVLRLPFRFGFVNLTACLQPTANPANGHLRYPSSRLSCSIV